MGVIIIGAGGHAKVAIATFHAAGLTVDGIYDDDLSKHGQKVLGVSVLGNLKELEKKSGLQAFVGIGNNAVRKKIAARFKFEWISAIHPKAYIHETVEIGKGVLICAGAVLQPSSILGDHSIINTSASVDHDCRLGAYTHLAPGAHLAGNVELEEGSFMGIGSSAIPGIRIGAWAVVGAGAAVVKPVPAECVAVGVPAKIVPKS